MTQIQALSRRAQLLVVRLLATSKQNVGPKRLRADLVALGAAVISNTDWADLLEELRLANLLATGTPIRLTESGRAAALRVLGLSVLPAKAGWTQIRDQYLVRLAAGAPHDERRLTTKGELAAFMLKRRFGLTTPEGATVAQVAAAVVCKELKFPGILDYRSLQAVVLARMLGSSEPLPVPDAIEQFVRGQFGARRGNVGELRQALIADWVRGNSTGEATPVAKPNHPPRVAVGGSAEEAAAFDLPAFAVAARRSAAHSPTGWFGDNKVFIAHAWRQYQLGRANSNLDLPSFKTRLLEANQFRLLTLSRADLVAAMDPVDVRESCTSYLNAEFHFILIEGDIP